MFQVTAVSFVRNGIKAILVLDDPADLMFLRFMREAERFAERFHHKVRIAKRVHERELDAPRRLAQARGDRGRLLAAYRSLPGSRRDRMRNLKTLLERQGRKVTTGGLEASLSVAVQEDRDVRVARIRDLSDQGRSVREIGRILGIPPATVDRLKKSRVDALQATISPSG